MLRQGARKPYWLIRPKLREAVPVVVQPLFFEMQAVCRYSKDLVGNPFPGPPLTEVRPREEDGGTQGATPWTEPLPLPS